METIGDCYVAVCGLAQMNPRHGIIMARFAVECRNKMQQVTEELASSLGEDTRDLQLRVGLHSGPTTGTSVYCWLLHAMARHHAVSHVTSHTVESPISVS